MNTKPIDASTLPVDLQWLIMGLNLLTPKRRRRAIRTLTAMLDAEREDHDDVGGK